MSDPQHTPKPTPGPRLGPRPGSHSGPRPGAMPRKRPAASSSAAPKNEPEKYGYVDAEGNVWVRTGTGDRIIGSWQAGTEAEGLAHFGARYDDYATEVELLETRVSTHPEEAESIEQTAQELLGRLATASIVGDIPALEQRLQRLIKHSEDAAKLAEAEKESRRQAAVAKKEALAAEAEDIAENSSDWKQAGDRIRAILDEWKKIKGIDRKTDDALWKRYSRARDSFNRRRGSHFAELDRSRADAKRAKEALIERAEELKVSTNWGQTAAAYRDLMKEWKSVGRAPRDVDEKLWQRFKAAQDEFFAARNAVNDARDKEFEENARLKEALLAEYDAKIAPAKNLDHARNELRHLQERWEEIGFVPRGRVREFEDKIGALERRVSQAADSQWRRTDPEAQARVQQFADRAAEFDAKATEFEAKGKTAKAEEARAQAEQWRQWADTAAHAVDDL